MKFPDTFYMGVDYDFKTDKMIETFDNAFQDIKASCIDSSEPTTCIAVMTQLKEDEILSEQLSEQKQLKDLYTQLVGNTREKSQKESQQAKLTQVKTNTVATVNYWLYILFYLACLVLGAMLFYFSKSPSILGMSWYIKIILLLAALTYPIWVQIVDQILVFIIRYLTAIIMGASYSKNVRQ